MLGLNGQIGVLVRVLLLLVTLIVALVIAVPSARADQPPLILGTTIDLQRTGLLDVLIPAFERQAGRTVTVIAVSEPHVLALGRPRANWTSCWWTPARTSTRSWRPGTASTGSW